MKKPFFLIIIALLFNAESRGQNESTFPPIDKLLLLNYFTHTTCKVIEANGKPVNDSMLYCGEILSDIDDFSDFFPVKRVFHFDGDWSISEIDKILLWEYGRSTLVAKSPFQQEGLQIRTFVNDSVIQVGINMKEKTLAPQEFLCDTLKFIKKDDNQTIEYTTITRIENLGLIEKEKVIDNSTWDKKKFEFNLDAPSYAEVMPEFPGGEADLMAYLLEKIRIPDSSIENISNTTAFVQFVVDETGKITMAKIIRGISPTINQQIIDIFYQMPLWKPGTNGRMAVPVKQTLPIHIELNQ